MMHQSEFPYHEIRKPDGDLFHTVEEAMLSGFDLDQVWSIVEGEPEDDNVHSIWCYGPPDHVVNRLGYICTKERHDHDTYYEEVEYRD